MGKYTIHSTKDDYEKAYAELKQIESTFKRSHLDWKKIKSKSLDEVALIISIIKRQVKNGLIELKENKDADAI